ncbi:MAG: hypothetical protein LAO05_16745 [Acidobacteriia bacterium]|nr:hypothetical protein [Terriglobia bacterium]
MPQFSTVGLPSSLGFEPVRFNWRALRYPGDREIDQLIQSDPDEFVAVRLRGKALTLLNAAINTVITAAALGAGLLSARMSYTQLSAVRKFFLVLLAVAAWIGGALFFFGDSGKRG